jgi:peptide/nickel transport system substrate-binding protein
MALINTGLTRRRFNIGLLAGAGVLMAGRGAFAQDVFTIAQPDDIQPQNIMPGRLANTTWVRNVFETITYIDPKTYEVQPQLATDWSLSDDGLTLELKLRDDVTYHTGRKFTAEDVKFTLETVAAKETAAQLGFIAREISAIDVAGDTEVKLTFNRRLPNIFELFDRTPVVDKETYADREGAKKIIGTGPYTFASWSPGASISIVPFEGYRDESAAGLGPIEIAIVTDPTAIISALRSGRAQAAIGLGPSDMIEFIGNPMYQIMNAGGSQYPLGVNVEMDPFKQKLMRQAVGFAVDAERINMQVFDGIGTPTPLYWQPGSPGYSDELARTYSYNPDKARELIKEAGGDGAKVTIALHALPTQRSIFEIVQNNLREVGLDIEANVMDVPSYGKAQIAGDLGQSFIALHGQASLSAATLLTSAPTLRKGNPSHFWSDEYAALRDAVSNARNADETSQTVIDLSKYMLDEAFVLNLVQAPSQAVMSAGITGAFYGLDGSLSLGGASRA